MKKELPVSNVINDYNPNGAALSGAILSQMLNMSLSRQYLDLPITKHILNNINTLNDTPGFPIWEFSPTNNTLFPLHSFFLHIKKLGYSNETKEPSLIESIKNVLSFCKSLGKYKLIFLIHSNLSTQNIFIGLAADENYDGNPISAGQALYDFIKANWLGAKCSIVGSIGHNTTNSTGINKAFQFIDEKATSLRAFTGVPSMRENGGWSQSLDRLMNGMGQNEYSYIIIAEPIQEILIDSVILKCRDLIGISRSWREITINNSESISQTLSKSVTISESTTHSTSTHKNIQAGIGFGGIANIGMAISALFPPAAPIALLGAFLMPNIGTSKSWGETFASTHVKSLTNSTSDGISNSQAISRTLYDAHSEAVEAMLRTHVDRFQKARSLGGWNVGVYLATSNPSTADYGAAQIQTLLSGTAATEPIRSHKLDDLKLGFKNIACCRNFPITITNKTYTFTNDQSEAIKTSLQHPLGPFFNSLTTVYNTDELALAMNLPRRPVPGLPIIEVPNEMSQEEKKITSKSILLGKQLYSGTITSIEYPIELQQLSKHLLICGINGSGKSKTCRRILQELLIKKKNFLVIEPAKDEYVEWAMMVNAEYKKQNLEPPINIFIPGRKEWNGSQLPELKLNPFDIIWLDEKTEPKVLEHIDRLKTIINSSLPMQEVLPVLMEELIYKVYSSSIKTDIDKNSTESAPAEAINYRWLPIDLNKDHLPNPTMRRPTFSQLRANIKTIIAEKGYDSRLSHDLQAALSTRIDSFRRGWKASVFDQEMPNPELWATIFDKPTVINLSAVASDDEKAFFMSILLQFLYEYRQAIHEKEKGRLLATPDLKHMVVIEEAHRILSNVPDCGPNSANPMAKVGQMFSNMISEMRAYGQGILIADQVPSRLHPDAIKNTNLKIVHRLVSGDDREMMSVCLDLKQSHGRLLGSLQPGEALVRSDMDNEAAWVKIELSKWDREEGVVETE